jgi:hypothetical protein
LELWYEVPAESGGLTTRLDPARPTDDAWVRETYWRLVLPERRYLLWSPGDVQREFSWQWQRWGWGRTNRAVVDEAAEQGVALALPEGVNAYLFSTLGSPPALAVASVDVLWLVVVASGLTFLVGALVLTLPWLRRREVLLGGAVLLVAAGLLYPELFLLVAQAASLGLVAVALVLALKVLISVSRPLTAGRSGGSTLASSGVFRGSSAPTRLSPGRESVGSSRAATVSSQQGPASKAVPATAGEGVSAGSSHATGAMVTSQGN